MQQWSCCFQQDQALLVIPPGPGASSCRADYPVQGRLTSHTGPLGAAVVRSHLLPPLDTGKGCEGKALAEAGLVHSKPMPDKASGFPCNSWTTV